MSEIGQPKRDDGVSKLLRILSKEYDLLVATGSDENLLKNFSALLRFLRSAKSEEMNQIFFRSPTTTQKQPPSGPQHTDAEISNFSIEQLERLINDPGLPRKFLERIAIHRFKVPRGSMRSFSNRRMLVDKLATLIRNEQTHTAIDTVARR